MDKIIFDALQHLRAMWRYRWLGLFAAWAIALIGAVVVLAIPKKYEASARIYVNTDSILKPLMVGMTVQPDNSQRVALLSRLLISRPNVDQLIQETGLSEKAKTPEQRERLIDDVIQTLEIQNSGERDNVFVVKFRDTVPMRAKHMVELLVAKFIESSKGGRSNDTDAAKQFLDEQASVYEKKLLEAEARLKEFKLHNMANAPGNLSGDGKDYFAQMANIGEQLNQAQLQLREAENSRDAYRRSLSSESETGTPAARLTPAGETIAEIDARTDAMKRNLDALLQRYTESHPDVAGTRRVIRELEQQRSQLAAEYRKEGIPLVPQGINTGPRASEQIKVSLAQAEASVASLRARVGEYSARLTQLREMARRVPEFEAELAQLNRDYDVNKKNYENLISRRESANIAGDMQSVAGVGDFRLIDPPRVSPSTKSPSRVLMLLASLVLAAGAGIGLTFLLKEVRARFYDSLQLRQATDLPLLGVISVVPNENSARETKRGTRRFTQTAVALMGVYFAVVFAGLMLTKTAT
ncbi:polysaccharide chain length determinant protein (PEP-CTERM system associated) [Actimicrobium sp. GrIS 1.19]|uniref:XrtA system polysaccharide chain length determinant n=1 Tax=Actimicrobium sp. GrIS 1.19 TaxID=3071708 RepID=UPI002E095295|nr:polysaccharide chain length determinant protein (PEP-CTERM system associated) [Actimicrobium sp. GrIS 1.19]